MDMWHRIGKIFRLSNLGTFIFFLLNIGLLLLIFCPQGITSDVAIPLLICYFATVLISLSPIGEYTLAAMAGAREIKRKDIKIRLIPLLEIVFNKAKQKTPSMVNSLNLKIIYDDSPNAFAIGRKTICVTSGLLNLSDELIIGVLAHEVGHIANRHSEIQLLIGGANLFITGFIMLLKILCWAIAGIMSLLAIGTKNFFVGILIAACGFMYTGLLWLWVKFCKLFLMWSMRKNEYVADEYAMELGYGYELAFVLDNNMMTLPENGLIKALYSTHPSNDDRIARLQDFGVNYSRY